MSSSDEAMKSFTGASLHAHQLSKRRLSSIVIQSPVTPVTPIVTTTPILAAHIFSEGNMMEDLQLAAELGKTLLERNKELEAAIKEQRHLLDDKTQEIEYLSKQTAALREANDSRLRIYEQLEISIQELEKSNQRLTAETNADKKKIKSLSGTVEQLEIKCEELQKSLEDAKALRLQHQQQQQHQQKQQQQKQQQCLQERGRTMTRRHFVMEENSNFMRRSLSCENAAQEFEDMASEFYEMKVRLASQQTKLSAAYRERATEISRREDLEIELECLTQENAVLRDQVEVLKERETNFRSLEDELTSLDETTSSKFCRKCMGLTDETGSNMTVQDFTEDIEEMDPSYSNIQGECALVRLNNGGYAWGSQESLASMGQIINHGGSSESSPPTEASEAPHNSLLSELDTQYRILIEKYEALVEGREQRKEQVKEHMKDLPTSGDTQCRPHSYINTGVDEISGPMSLVMTEVPPHEESVNVVMRCQRCTTCSCDLKQISKSNLEELSEVETSSSGFSEGESRIASKLTQTENLIEFYSYSADMGDDATTPTAVAGVRYLDLHNSMNPCDARFQNKPEYWKIFHEIFEIIKNDLDRKNQIHPAGKCNSRHKKENDKEKPVELETETETDVSTEISFRDENEENKSPNARLNQAEAVNMERKAAKQPETMPETKKLVKGEDSNRSSKPVRPDFLDLDSSSRCSSRSRKRRKQHRNRAAHIPQPNGQEFAQQQQTKQIKEQQVKQPTKLAGNNPVTIPETSTALPDVSPAAGRSPSREQQKQECSKSSKVKCEHKSRKSRQQKNKSQPLQNKHLNNVLGQRPISLPSKPFKEARVSSCSAVASETMPSVQVAKLIRFEKSYADVLKSKPKRPL